MHCKFHYFKIGQNWAEGKFLTVAIWYLENLWEKNHLDLPLVYFTANIQLQN